MTTRDLIDLLRYADPKGNEEVVVRKVKESDETKVSDHLVLLG